MIKHADAEMLALVTMEIISIGEYHKSLSLLKYLSLCYIMKTEKWKQDDSSITETFLVKQKFGLQK